MHSNLPLDRDYLWLNIRELPYFRGLMRAYEASFYRDISLPGPVLDLGSGDGQFVNVAFDHPIDIGLDPWKAPMKEAARRQGYRRLVLGNGAQMPFPNAVFGSAISNSVLEHIPPIDQVLVETARVLKPGAPFIFCGPNDRFLEGLSIGRFLDRAGLCPLGNCYRAFFNRISRHINCDSPLTWTRRLNQAGFTVEQFWHYYPPSALQVTEWGHYLGLPALVAHWLTGRWILLPTRWNMALTERYTRRHFDPRPCDDGVCTFYIARRDLS